MIIEILDQIIDAYLDKSNPENLAHKGCVLVKIYLGKNPLEVLIQELEAKLPLGTKFRYLEDYRGIPLDDSNDPNVITPVYEIKKP